MGMLFAYFKVQNFNNWTFVSTQNHRSAIYYACLDSLRMYLLNVGTL